MGNPSAATYRRIMSASLDIVQLKTFVAIDACGGFGRAATALHMSQPTVSQHVRLLERRLGQALVEKDGRRAKFTPAGERLLIEARRIIAVHDEALSRLDASTLGVIVVGSTETAADELLPELLTTIREAYPDRAVQFHINRSTQLTDSIARGEVDLAVLLDTSNSVPGVELGALDLCWYAAPGWQRPEDGRPIPLVAYVEPCGMRQRALQVLGETGQRIEITVESTSLEGVTAAARAGLGIAVLPTAGRTPAGLMRLPDLPDLGKVSVRLATRRGIDPRIDATATRALESFFRKKRSLFAVPA